MTTDTCKAEVAIAIRSIAGELATFEAAVVQLRRQLDSIITGLEPAAAPHTTLEASGPEQVDTVTLAEPADVTGESSPSAPEAATAAAPTAIEAITLADWAPATLTVEETAELPACELVASAFKDAEDEPAADREEPTDPEPTLADFTTSQIEAPAQSDEATAAATGPEVPAIPAGTLPAVIPPAPAKQKKVRAFVVAGHLAACLVCAVLSGAGIVMQHDLQRFIDTL